MGACLLSLLAELEQIKTAVACLQMALQSRNKWLQSICGNRIYTQLFLTGLKS